MLAPTRTVTEARGTPAEQHPWESPPLTPGMVAQGQEEEEEQVAMAALHRAGLLPLVPARLQAEGERAAATEECPLQVVPLVCAAGTAARATALVLQAKEVDRRPMVLGVV